MVHAVQNQHLISNSLTDCKSYFFTVENHIVEIEYNKVTLIYY